MNLPLIFRLLDSDRAEWLTEGGGSQQGALTDLAIEARGRRGILAAPGESLLLTQAKVPGRRRSMWAKAIPYAVEENLTEDVEKLHFALGEPQEDGSIAVAVIRHQILEAWLAACTQAGITPAAVVPDPLLLPHEPGTWSLLLEGKRAVIRTGPWSGFAMEQETFPLFLQTALMEASDRAPQRLQVWGEFPPEWIELEIDIHHTTLRPEPLELFAEGYGPNTVINLLQGPYSRQASWGRWLRPWRVAAVLAGLWLGLQGVIQIIEYWHLQQQQTALRAAKVAVFREAVPEAQRIVNPRVQMENRLRALQEDGAPEQSAFLDLLHRTGRLLVNAEGVTLQGLRYRNEQLDLDLQGVSLEALDRLRQRLNETGLAVQMRTTRREDRIESQVTLTKAAS